MSLKKRKSQGKTAKRIRAENSWLNTLVFAVLSVTNPISGMLVNPALLLNTDATTVLFGCKGGKVDVYVYLSVDVVTTTTQETDLRDHNKTALLTSVIGGVGKVVVRLKDASRSDDAITKAPLPRVANYSEPTAMGELCNRTGSLNADDDR